LQSAPGMQRTRIQEYASLPISERTLLLDKQMQPVEKVDTYHYDPTEMTQNVD